MSDGGSLQVVSRQIMTYFIRNSSAADNLEGIARWRLLEEAVHRSVDETSRALAELVDRGLLLRTLAPGGTPIYSLNEAAWERARQFVRDTPARAGDHEERDGCR